MRVHARLQSIATALLLLPVAACAERQVAEQALGPNLAAPRQALSPLPAGGSYWGLNVNPAAPLAFVEPGWDVQIYSRDGNTWYTPEPVSAHHGMDCGAYPAVHQVTRYEDMVFRCRNHIMTSINASGYGAIVLTPDQMLDFSKTDGIVRFDLTTFRSSLRDWVNVWVSAFDEQLAVPATSDAPGLTGPARNGLFVQQSSRGNLCPHYVNNFVVTPLPCADWPLLGDRMPLSATVRSTVEIRISRTHVKVWLPNENIVFSDTDLPAPLSFDTGVVQFGHYSYSPTKCDHNCANVPASTPNTWHWDEIYLAPSTPFSITRADRRYVDGTGGVLTFAVPAPKNARLRFFAVGMGPDLSFDNGTTWTPAVEQTASRLGDPERSYWSPVPEGITQVRLRPKRPIAWWVEPNRWMARDFAIFSTASAPAPVASIVVALAAPSLLTGQTTSATATLFDANSAILTGRAVTWTSSNPAVATVSSTGAISALTAGTTVVTATSGGVSGTATLTVTAPTPVASVSVAFAMGAVSGTVLAVGQGTTAIATLRDAANTILTGRSVAWTSSNTAVATISATGAIVAIAPGTATFTATSGGVSGQASITVAASDAVASVEVSMPSLSLTVGQTQTANAVVRAASGAELSGRTILWRSTNALVASISTSGVVTARAAGSTLIMASTGGRVGLVTLTVTIAKPPTS